MMSSQGPPGRPRVGNVINRQGTATSPEAQLIIGPAGSDLRYLTPLGTRTILSAVTEPGIKLAICTQLATGMRVKELVRMKRQDLDLKKGYVHVSARHGSQVVPILPVLSSALDLYYKYVRPSIPRHDAFFKTIKGEPLTVQRYTARLRKTVGDLGWSCVTSEHLRMTFMVIALDGGVPLDYVQAVMGRPVRWESQHEREQIEPETLKESLIRGMRVLQELIDDEV